MSAAKPTPRPSPMNKAAAVERAKAAKASALKALRPQPLAEGPVITSLYGLLANLILTGALLAYVYGNQRADIIFAVQHDGQLTPLQAMDTPNTSSEAVINWAKMAIGETFTYNFNDIVVRLNASRSFFTDSGWDSFRSAFKDQSIMANTQAQRQFVTTLPTGAAVISEEGMARGRYYWTVQMETLTSVYTGTSTVSGGAMSIKIERIPTKESRAGYPFGIVKITQ